MLKVILFKLCVAVARELLSVREKDFHQVVQFVQEAEVDSKLSTGEERRNRVRDRILDRARQVAPFAIDTLIGLAVGYANRAGLINVRNKPFRLA